MSKDTNSNNIANPDLTPQKLGEGLFRVVSRGAPIENIRNLITPIMD